MARVPARTSRRVRETGDAPAYTLKSLPAGERPRERLLQGGAGALSDGELLAIILRTGLPGEMVTELATDLLGQFNGFWGLHGASIEQLSQRRGLKGAKIAQIKAVMEIGKRMRDAAPESRPQVGSADAAFELLRYDMTALEQEEMWVLLLDTSNTQCHPSTVGGRHPALGVSPRVRRSRVWI
jgi:DNA repair protein RadC